MLRRRPVQNLPLGPWSKVPGLPRRCWTRLAKRAGKNFRSSSFSSDRRRTNIPASWRWHGNSIGVSLAFDGERILEWHILTKYFAGRRTAVDVFYSIHKAAIFNAEQLILGTTASQYVESLRLKGKLFPLLTSLNPILSHFLPSMPRLLYQVHRYIIRRQESQWRRVRLNNSKTTYGNSQMFCPWKLV